MFLNYMVENSNLIMKRGLQNGLKIQQMLISGPKEKMRKALLFSDLEIEIEMMR